MTDKLKCAECDGSGRHCPNGSVDGPCPRCGGNGKDPEQYQPPTDKLCENGPHKTECKHPCPPPTDKLDVAGGMEERIEKVRCEIFNLCNGVEDGLGTVICKVHAKELIDRVVATVLESAVEAMTLEELPHEMFDDEALTQYKAGYRHAIDELERRKRGLMGKPT